MSSIHEVAKQAGVSTATVSRTFSAPELLNAQTQERVLAVARSLNYQPRRARDGKNRLAFAQGRAVVAVQDTIGFQFFASVHDDLPASNAFYAPILAGAQAEASALGFHLLLHTTDAQSFSQATPKMVSERAVAGLLLVGTMKPEVLAAFANNVPHVVLVDNRDESGTVESVISDGFGGAYKATRHLLDLGHQRIGFFLSNPDVTTFRDRLRGYLCALQEAGISIDPAWTVRENGVEASQKHLAELLSGANRPTALVAANDWHAFAALRVCRELGLTVPGDVSLTGFDDIAFSVHADPPLTTIRVEKEFMGRLAVRRLVARLRGEVGTFVSDVAVCNQVPVSLIVRASCRAL